MRKLLLAVALGSALSAHAADSKFDSFMGTVVGNTTTVTFGGNGQPIATSSNHLGTPSANTVGNMGVAMVNGDPHYVGRAEAPVAGTNKKVPVDVKVPINKKSVARALIAAAKYGAGGAGGIAVGYAAEALLDFGFKNLKVGLDGSLEGAKDVEGGYQISDGNYWSNGNDGKKYLSPEAAGLAFTVVLDGFFGAKNEFQSCSIASSSSYSCKIKLYTGSVNTYVMSAAGASNCLVGSYVVGGNCTTDRPSQSVSERQVEDAIASASGWPTSATGAIAQMSADPRVEPLITTENPNITGPFKIQETPTVRTFSEPV